MSSLVRRIQRQLYPSQKVHCDSGGIPYSNQPRHKFYGKNLFHAGRGSQLGVTNPKCKSLLARLAREKRNSERSK